MAITFIIIIIINLQGEITHLHKEKIKKTKKIINIGLLSKTNSNT